MGRGARWGIRHKSLTHKGQKSREKARVARRVLYGIQLARSSAGDRGQTVGDRTMRTRIEQRAGGWYVVDANTVCALRGPYLTEAEAAMQEQYVHDCDAEVRQSRSDTARICGTDERAYVDPV